MSEILLSWNVGKGANRSGGNKKNATWSDIQKALASARDYSGTVTLENLSAPEIGPQNLQTQTSNGQFIISLGVDDGEDYFVRSYCDTSRGGGKTEILGNIWPATAVCIDFGLILRVFKEFVETGDVSSDLLN